MSSSLIRFWENVYYLNWDGFMFIDRSILHRSMRLAHIMPYMSHMSHIWLSKPSSKYISSVLVGNDVPTVIYGIALLAGSSEHGSTVAVMGLSYMPNCLAVWKCFEVSLIYSSSDSRWKDRKRLCQREGRNFPEPTRSRNKTSPSRSTNSKFVICWMKMKPNLSFRVSTV